MKQRTLVIFSILIVVAVVTILFIYFYRVKIDELVKNYADTISTCGNITNEEECYKKEFCEGVYGPSCPTCNDKEFISCRRISKKMLSELKREQQVCIDSGAQWYKNKFGSFCLCELVGQNKIFNKYQGCVDK